MGLKYFPDSYMDVVTQAHPTSTSPPRVAKQKTRASAKGGEVQQEGDNRMSRSAANPLYDGDDDDNGDGGYLNVDDNQMNTGGLASHRVTSTRYTAPPGFQEEENGVFGFQI